ncbi:MAG: hypothetical protein Q4C10_00730 [Clostridia bacterium]|nr:hypothetical protein [Clostridia bacterium]
MLRRDLSAGPAPAHGSRGAGNHGKKRYNLRYATLKAWGYRPLVHEYYAQRKESAEDSANRP